MAKPRPHLLFTSEHGGNVVPPSYRHLFAGADEVLATHRGWDPGAKGLAEKLAARFDAPLVSAVTTRLLVDLNRSAKNKAAFSEFTRELPQDEKDAILAKFHTPHWNAVRKHLDTHRGRTIHIGVHTFTPVMNGVVRNARVGLLYDPRRPGERELAGRWQSAFRELCDFPIRLNYPYKGNTDGLPFAMRKHRGDDVYTGIELELNHEWFFTDRPKWNELVKATIESLESALR